MAAETNDKLRFWSILGSAVGGLTFVLLVGSQLLGRGVNEGKLDQRVASTEAAVSELSVKVDRLDREASSLRATIEWLQRSLP